MSLRDFYRSAGNYFSRREYERVPINDDRGRNAQVGYKQRETWFDRFLARTGKFLKYFGFGAAVATGIGAIALGVQYLRGSWPYRDNRENAWVITQNAINEKPAEPLRPGVNVFVPPFVRIVRKENGEPEKIDGTIQSAETPEFEYRSAEGYKVKLRTQYNYQVTTGQGANKVFWDYGGLERAHESLDTIIENVLMNELSKVPAKDVAAEERIAKEGERISSGGRYVTAIGGEKVNYLIEAENRANEILAKERTGVAVTNFAISNPKFTGTIESAWEAPARAEATVIEEQGKAQARIVKARSEAEEANILSEATLRNTERYIDAGRRIAEQTGQSQKAGDYAMALQERDNTQQIANSGGRIFYAPNGIGGAQTPVVIQNIGQAQSSSKTPKDIVEGENRT
jgi:regulator of protease activity HflC (stomatin/prohibitin superfamily)